MEIRDKPPVPSEINNWNLFRYLDSTLHMIGSTAKIGIEVDDKILGVVDIDIIMLSSNPVIVLKTIKPIC